MSRRCRQTRLALPFVDGDLATDEALRFEEHFGDCASCRAAVDTQRSLDEALAALPRPRLLLPDRARLQEQIAQRIEAAATAPARRQFPVRRVAAAAALLAATAIVAARLLPPPSRTATLPDERSIPSTATEPEIAVADSPSPRSPTSPTSTGTADAFAVGFDGPPTNWALLLAARDEVAQILRRRVADRSARANGDLLSSFVAATQPMQAAGIAPATALLALLKDPDPELACAAADLFARAAASGDGGDLGRIDQSLVPTLEAAMARSDRGAAMVQTLAAIGTPRAWDAVLRACQRDELRPLALRLLVAKGPAYLAAALESQLRQGLREPEQREIVAAALASLTLERPDQVRLLAGLLRAGASASSVTDAVASVLARGGEPAAALIAEGLGDRRAATRRDALLLAPLLAAGADGATGPRERLVAPLAALVVPATRPEESAAALAALARIGGAATLRALIDAAGVASLANSQAREIAAAFATALDATADVAGALASVRAERPSSGPLLLELCRIARGPGGTAARAALLFDAPAADGAHAAIALEIALRDETVAAARVAELLADERIALAGGDRRAGDDGWTAALLVLLYDQEGDAGLALGVQALGLELPRPQLDRLRDAARSVMRGLAHRRDLARVDALLRLAP